MNQILYTIENEEEKNRVRSIILFFAIAIIIFGLALTSMGGYQVVSAKAERDKAIEAAKVPEVTLNAEDNQVIVGIKHSKEIKQIIYSWNNGEEVTIDKNTTEEISEYIDIPGGENTLNIKVIDSEGKTTTKTQKFAYEGTYMDLSVINNKSLKIIATNVEGLQSITYKWSSGEETVAYPSGDSNVIEIISDIPIGINTITIKAIDNNNNIQTKEQSVQGVTRPTMKITYNTERTHITIKLSDIQGIQSYSYSLSYAPISEIAVDEQIIPNFKEKLTTAVSDSKTANGELELIERLELQDGFNYLEVTITNIEGAQETFTGWCAK